MKVWMRGLRGVAHRLAAAIDVLEAGAGQPGHGGALDPPGDLAHRLEIAFGGDREAGLDDVDAHLVEQLGDLELLFQGHGGAGRLLAIAQRGVEDEDPVAAGGSADGLGHGGTGWVGGAVGHGQFLRIRAVLDHNNRFRSTSDTRAGPLLSVPVSPEHRSAGSAEPPRLRGW